MAYRQKRVALRVIGSLRTLDIKSVAYMRRSNCRYVATVKDPLSLEFFGVYRHRETGDMFAVKV